MREHDQASGRLRHNEIAEKLESTAGRDAHFTGAQNRPGWRIVGVAGEQLGDLRIRGRLEVLIPQPDRPHQLRLEQADDLVGFPAQRPDRVWRAHRHGEDQPSRLARPHGP